MNEFFLKEGITGKYLNFGDYKDPDEFLNNSGLLAMSKLIDDAPLFIDFQLQNLKIAPRAPQLTQKLRLSTSVLKYSPLRKQYLHHGESDNYCSGTRAPILSRTDSTRVQKVLRATKRS